MLSPEQTLTLVLTVAGTLISLLITACTALLIKAMRDMTNKVNGTHSRLDSVSARLHNLTNWCHFLAGKNGWEPPAQMDTQ